MSGGGLDRDSVWREFRAAQCVCGRGQQRVDLFRLFYFAGIEPGVGQRRLRGAMAGGLGTELFFRRDGNVFDF